MVAFDIKNKVALITGGASGLGFQYAFTLLDKGAKGVTLADINSAGGNEAVKKIENKYGKHRVIFVKTDISSYEQFEEAFKKTIEVFKNIDILINNAGILNDTQWEREVAINVNGTINGMILGLENYLSKYKSGAEAVILNTSSIAVCYSHSWFPIYTGTKFAIHGMTLAWGYLPYYDRTKVRVVGVCPGPTLTPLVKDARTKHLISAYNEIKIDFEKEPYNPQTPEQAAPLVIQIIEKAPPGTLWVVEAGEPPYKYEMPNRSEIRKEYLQ